MCGPSEDDRPELNKARPAEKQCRIIGEKANGDGWVVQYGTIVCFIYPQIIHEKNDRDEEG